jgi:hypothetical protein
MGGWGRAQDSRKKGYVWTTHTKCAAREPIRYCPWAASARHYYTGDPRLSSHLCTIGNVHASADSQLSKLNDRGGGRSRPLPAFIPGRLCQGDQQVARNRMPVRDSVGLTSIGAGTCFETLLPCHDGRVMHPRWDEGFVRYFIGSCGASIEKMRPYFQKWERHMRQRGHTGVPDPLRVRHWSRAERDAADDLNRLFNEAVENKRVAHQLRDLTGIRKWGQAQRGDA